MPSGGQQNCKPAPPARLAVQLNPSAVRPRDPVRHGQPYSRTFHVEFFGRPATDELSEYLPLLLRRDSGPLVRDGDTSETAPVFHRYGNGGTFGRILDRVVQQVAQRQRNRIGIGVDDHIVVGSL